MLLSGGLDSAVALYLAVKNGYQCYPLAFDYGQRHKKELVKARRLAKELALELKVVDLDFPWKGSSLTDESLKLPTDRSICRIKSGIPSTYVPARNTVFLAIASSYAEAIGAGRIFIGAHSEDSSGYPDCRKEYLEAFDKAIKLGTKSGLEKRLSLEFPLIDKSKRDIIELGVSLGVPFQFTWSCYEGGSIPCGRCDSCILRAKGFKEAKAADPLMSERRAEISDIFSSIQGEGVFLGARQVFVRFKDCNLSCAFCDEPRDSEIKEYSPEELMDQVEFLEASRGPHHSVSLTGGEPLLYADFLKVFLKLLKEKGLKAYLETNGTLPGELSKVIDLVDIIAMDFKLPSSTLERPFWDEHRKFLKLAAKNKVFVKVILTPNTAVDDINKAISLLKEVDKSVAMILQPATPMKTGAEAVGKERLLEFLEMAAAKGLDNVRIVPQMHRLLKVK